MRRKINLTLLRRLWSTISATPVAIPKITEMFTRYFRMPDGFDNFVYLSQYSRA